jgi:hypothetical protein
MVAVNIVVPVGLYIVGLAGGIGPGLMFGGEGNVITWFSTSQMIVIGIVAYLNAVVIWWRRPAGQPRFGSAWLWLTFAAGFVFLAADEQLMIHEWLRHEVFVPRELFTTFAYVEEGEVGLAICVVVGLVLMVFLGREMGWRSTTFRLFVAAAVLSTIVVATDAVPFPTRARAVRALGWEGKPGDVLAPSEEVGECWGQLLFLLSFLAALRARIAPDR